VQRRQLRQRVLRAVSAKIEPVEMDQIDMRPGEGLFYGASMLPLGVCSKFLRDFRSYSRSLDEFSGDLGSLRRDHNRPVPCIHNAPLQQVHDLFRPSA
jgi:hypothetical protein